MWVETRSAMFCNNICTLFVELTFFPSQFALHCHEKFSVESLFCCCEHRRVIRIVSVAMVICEKV